MKCDICDRETNIVIEPLQSGKKACMDCWIKILEQVAKASSKWVEKGEKK